MEKLNYYRIANDLTGLDLGVFPGADEQEAIRAMYIDAGYGPFEEVPIDASELTATMTDFPVWLENSC
ncbi:MAG TPA: hypothetical protein DD435_01645 [Cyanobacteria bacterium UBA8530]|nr:hypothetical protein [Cyanobacteria bacterium UBA8530]